jgi:6-phosphogluconolactonase
MNTAFAGASGSLIALVILTVAACGGGSGDGGYTVGGVVTGLMGSGLVLRDNSGDDLPISTNGTFTFKTRLSSNAAYHVTVFTQPTNPVQNCLVMNARGSGTVTATNVTAVAVVCANVGRFVYVGNSLSYNVSAFAIDPITGALAPVAGSPFASAIFAGPIIVDPNGKFAYVSGGGSVSAFTIDPISGALTMVAGGPFTCPVAPSPLEPGFSVGIAVPPSGGFLYDLCSYAWQPPPFSGPIFSPDGVVALLSIEPNTGVLQAGSLFGVGAGSTSFSFDPSGTHMYVENQGDFHRNYPASTMAFPVDSTTGALGPVSLSAPGYALYLAFDPTGNFAYAAYDDGSIRAFTVDVTTGALADVTGSSLGSVFTPGYYTSVTVDPSGTFTYILSLPSHLVSVLKNDASNGAPAPVMGSPFATSGDLLSLAFDPSGKFAYGACGDGLCAYSIDSASGALHAVAGSPFVSVGAYAVAVAK